MLIQVFTSAVPFGNGTSTTAALTIVNGGRPPRPTHPALTEDVWVLVQHCWNQDPNMRPEAQEVLKVLHASSVSHPFLQQLHCLSRFSPGFHDQLTEVLHGKKFQKHAPNLQGDDLVWLIDYLDKVCHHMVFHPSLPKLAQALNVLGPTSSGFQKCLDELKSICGTRAILPTSYTPSLHPLNIDSEPFASGSVGDVYHGSLNGSRVCVKRMRTSYYGQKNTIGVCF